MPQLRWRCLGGILNSSKTMELTERISTECKRIGLLWDGNPPALIAPDVYIIKAVPLTEECHSKGQCKVETYTVLIGKDIKVMK